MEREDIIFEPHNDMEIDDFQIVEQHKNLIKNEMYDDATTHLNDMNYSKGFRASLFNSIQNKIHLLQDYLLNKYVAEEDEFYSHTEPTDEQMEGKTWWIQPY